MFLNNPVSFAEAVRHLAGKRLLPTGLDSAALRQLSAAVRRQSLFSARTVLTDYLDEVRTVVDSVLDPKQVTRTDDQGEPLELTVTEGFNPASARQELRRKLTKLGYSPSEEQEGTIQDLSSAGRINLVVKTNVELAQGAGRFVQQNVNSDVVEAWPALELVRYEQRTTPRDWPGRWRVAAQVANDPRALAALVNHGRMAALKSSGVWQALGDGAGGQDDTLGNPYPPFAFNSGMWTEELSRDEAEALGLLSEGEPVRGAAFDFAGIFGADAEVAA